jgi:hypothetical protein
LIDKRLTVLARGLMIDEARWRKNTAFEPERLVADRVSGLNAVEDAQPRMTSPPGYPDLSDIDELLSEEEAADDV